MLPKLPYVMKKNRQQTVAMRGINFSNATADGDIADSKGIGLQAYPYLATRKGRARIFEDGKNVIEPEEGGGNTGEPEVENVEVIDFTYFYGKKVEVRAEEGGAGLYYGGGRVCDVTLSEKQFAKINSKLVIFPDKIYLEESGRVHPLEAQTTVLGATFDTSSVKFNIDITSGNTRKDRGTDGVFSGNTFTPSGQHTAVFEGHKYLGVRQGDPTHTEDGDKIYSAGIFDYAISVNATVWSTPVTTPTTDGYSSVDMDIASRDITRFFAVGEYIYIRDLDTNCEEDLSGIYLCLESNIPDPSDTEHAGYIHVSGKVRVHKPAGTVTANYLRNHKLAIYTIAKIDYAKYFSIGYISVSSLSGRIDRFLALPYDKYMFGIAIKNNEKPPESAPGVALYTTGWDMDSFRTLAVGARVVFTGTYKDSSNGHLTKNILNNNFVTTITEVTENSITVEDTFEDEDLEASVITIHTFVDGIPSLDEFKAGDAVVLSGCNSSENNISFIIDKIDGNTVYTMSDVFIAGDDENVLTLERKVPKLDFICESNNRLWGCCNADNMIYGSSWGDPTNMYVYDDSSAASSAVVPVASEGKFTACCRYGDSVLFWKEDKLHKMLGSSPEDYALYDYDIDGVQVGAHKSIAIINETLYYKGVHGIYAFAGSTPRLISQNFGDRRFGGGAGGGYGNKYYFSTSDGERNYLFVYDTLLGMWVLEDDVHVQRFFREDGDELYMLTEGGEVYRCDAGESETGIEWFVQFIPFYETIEGRKSYSRIKLRVEIPQGSYMSVSVRCDGGRWHECGKIVGKSNGVVPVAIPINRCDKFEIKLSGKGKCTILSMMREFYVGGDR